MPEKMRNARKERIKAMKKYAKQGWGEVPRMDELTDEQWALVEPLLPKVNEIGRPMANRRRVLNGVLFYIRNALTWANIPPDYPSGITLFRRYHEWLESGLLVEVIDALTRHLGEVSGLDYDDALRSKKLSFGQKDRILTLYLPDEYSIYWMQPTATLLIMWWVNRTLDLYTEAYRKMCRDRNVDRIYGEDGPRKVRPTEVVIVIGPNPAKKKVEKPNLNRERLEFMDKRTATSPLGYAVPPISKKMGGIKGGPMIPGSS